MINIRAQTYFAAFRFCGCLSTCVSVDYENSSDLTRRWQAQGLTVRKMTGDELIKLEWGCVASREKNHDHNLNLRSRYE